MKVKSYNIIRHIGLEKLYLFVMYSLDLQPLEKSLSNSVKYFVMQLPMPQ